MNGRASARRTPRQGEEREAAGAASDPARTALVAIGGNSLAHDGDASIDTQQERIRYVAAQIARLVAGGWRVVVTHGNGPQVGAALIRSERAAAEAYPMPLDVCVASTQGEMGLLLASAVSDALRARAPLAARGDGPESGGGTAPGAREAFLRGGTLPPVASLVTRVVVSPTDPSFERPSKPIGPFYARERAEELTRSGWRLVEQPPRGWRRIVASPEPLEVPEEAVIRTLLDAGTVVIALGGGGVPVVRSGIRLVGVEAVVDKDLSSALLATRLGAELLVILTDVDGVYLDFATPAARRLETVRADDLRAHARAGHFAPGSMGPKVEALLRFIEAGGAHAVVALPEQMRASLESSHGAGTHVYGGEAWSASAL